MENAISKWIKYRVLKYLVFIIFTATIIVVACNSSTEEKKSPFLNVYGDANYVGSEVCANCHVANHESFMHTGMGMSFDSATPSKSVADFSNSTIYDSMHQLYYKAFWKDKQLFIKEWALENGDTTHQRTELISYIIGSGQHTNSHFWVDNGYVYQAPITWYVQEKKWGLPPGYEVNNIRFNRKIEIECMSCHNSLPSMDKASTYKYLDIPNGIGCERCHGPASLHVEEKMKGIIVDVKKEADYTIVNPKRLPWKLQIDICQRCHLQGNAVLKEGKSFEDFRPGMLLSDIMQVYMPTYSNDNHDFIMASHAERFQQSKCFIKSNTQSLEAYNAEINFTCINCHNPHISIKETKISNFNNTCKNCHQANKNQITCSADLNLRKEQEDNCVSCHMPLSNAKDIPHVSIHDHYIRKNYTQNNTENKGKLAGLKSVNGGKEDDYTMLKAYLTYFEKLEANPFYMEKADAYASKLNLDKFNALNVHYWYNKQNFAKVNAMAKTKDSGKVSSHFMAYQLAQSCYNNSDFILAKFWYNHALHLKPKQTEYLIARAINSISLTEIEAAAKDLKFAMQLQSKNERAFYYYGLINEMNQKKGIAKVYYQKALALDPFYKEAKKRFAQLNF